MLSMPLFSTIPALQLGTVKRFSLKFGFEIWDFISVMTFVRFYMCFKSSSFREVFLGSVAFALAPEI